MKKNKILLIGVLLATTIVSSINIYYPSNLKYVFAQKQLKRKFDEPMIFNPVYDKEYYKNLDKAYENLNEEQLKPYVGLTGTFIKEEPSTSGILLDFYIREINNIVDRYIKIELENLSEHKADKERKIDLFCGVDIMKNTRLDFFKVPKLPKNNKITYVLETIPGINYYKLDIFCSSGYAPSFNVTVTSGNTLESLGVDSISTATEEKTIPIVLKSKDNIIWQTNRSRKFDINSYNKDNLNLKIENKSEDEYIAFLYDKSYDVYDWRLYPKPELHKEYKISPNTTLNENIKNFRGKQYELELVPAVLKKDYLKLRELEIQVWEEEKIKNLELNENNSRLLKKYNSLNKQYTKKFEEIISKQRGNVYYKIYN